jgi:hypothetical protein
VEPAPTRATSGQPSHPNATLTPTRDQTPDDGMDDHARERSGLVVVQRDAISDCPLAVVVD